MSNPVHLVAVPMKENAPANALRRAHSDYYSPERWRDILAASIGEEAELERIREATRTGRPLGSPDFIRDVGLRIGRSLERRKAGRPPKDAVDEVEKSYFMISGNRK